MPVKLYYQDEQHQNVHVDDSLTLTFVGELQRDTDRKVQPAYVSITLRAQEMKIANLADVPRYLRQLATRINEKLNQMKAGSREESIHGGIIKE